MPSFSFSPKNLGAVNFLMRFIPGIRNRGNVSTKNIFIEGHTAPSTIRLRIYKPEGVNQPTPVLLWMHGGGYIMGRPEIDERGSLEYARELDMMVISVDYRLSPKFPFPAALNDCFSALEWLVHNAQMLNIDPRRIAVGGNSAGAGLAAALAQKVFDQSDIQIAFQLLVYPMLDDRTVRRTDIDDRNNLTWDHKSNQFGWGAYLGEQCATEHTPPYAVPARRSDLSGLPPAWIGVGSLDIFHDEDVMYADRLKEDGVECQLEVVPGAFHGFDVFSRKLPVVQEFRKSQMAALQKYLFTTNHS